MSLMSYLNVYSNEVSKMLPVVKFMSGRIQTGNQNGNIRFYESTIWKYTRHID
jgi:hypothetical protein